MKTGANSTSSAKTRSTSASCWIWTSFAATEKVHEGAVTGRSDEGSLPAAGEHVLPDDRVTVELQARHEPHERRLLQVPHDHRSPLGLLRHLLQLSGLPVLEVWPVFHGVLVDLLRECVGFRRHRHRVNQ